MVKSSANTLGVSSGPETRLDAGLIKKALGGGCYLLCPTTASLDYSLSTVVGRDLA
jgi:hypothetical protein